MCSKCMHTFALEIYENDTYYTSKEIISVPHPNDQNHIWDTNLELQVSNALLSYELTHHFKYNNLSNVSI